MGSSLHRSVLGQQLGRSMTSVGHGVVPTQNGGRPLSSIILKRSGAYTSEKVLGGSPVTNVIRKLEKELTTNGTARLNLNCLQIKTDTGRRAVGHAFLAKKPY